MNGNSGAILDRPVPPSKPPAVKKIGGGGRYFIKARCEVLLRRSEAGSVVGEAWGFSQYIGVMQRVEDVARVEAAKRYEEGDYEVSPPVCSFFPQGDDNMPVLDEIFYADFSKDS